MGNACSRKVEAQAPLNPPKPAQVVAAAYTPVATNAPAKSGGGSLGKICGCFCCLVVLFGAAYGGLVIYMSKLAIDGFITLHDSEVQEYCTSGLNMANITENLWWPGCGLMTSMADFSKCPAGGCVKVETMQAMDLFNKQNPGALVSYYSRPGTMSNGKAVPVIKLTGWWLPAPNHGPLTPRIVLQHGHTSNSNKHRQMYVAYQLRKLGFSVLVNNLRDHCYSDDTVGRLITWGEAYPYDTLGAWDAAVNDPAGVFGGKAAANKVGIMGFSMGAFLTTIAFGLEPSVPGVWVDAPPFTAKDGFAHGALKTLDGMGIGLLAPILMPPVWFAVGETAKRAGVDLAANTPEKALPKGPATNRSIFWVANKQDATVNIEDGEKLASVIRSYPAAYNLAGFWQTDGLCNGHSHCEDHLRIPELYEARLCSFWNGVFGLVGNTCGFPVASGVVPVAPVAAAPVPVAVTPTAAPVPPAPVAPVPVAVTPTAAPVPPAPVRRLNAAADIIV